MMRRCSATRSARSRGSNFSIRRCSACGRRTRTDTGFTLTEEPPEAPKWAFLGVRSCELHAIGIQDRVFLQGPYVDPHYASRRANVFIIAVNCGQAGGTCFCASMHTGPQARAATTWP